MFKQYSDAMVDTNLRIAEASYEQWCLPTLGSCATVTERQNMSPSAQLTSAHLQVENGKEAFNPENTSLVLNTFCNTIDNKFEHD
jgi:hypothetical protein